MSIDKVYYYYLYQMKFMSSYIFSYKKICIAKFIYLIFQFEFCHMKSNEHNSTNFVWSTLTDDFQSINVVLWLSVSFEYNEKGISESESESLHNILVWKSLIKLITEFVHWNSSNFFIKFIIFMNIFLNLWSHHKLQNAGFLSIDVCKLVNSKKTNRKNRNHSDETWQMLDNTWFDNFR